MVFSDTTNKQGIVQQIRLETGASETDLPIQDLTRLVNMGLDAYMDIALPANNDWEIDDTTYSTHATATTNLVSGQRDYSFPASLLDLISVEVKNSAGDFQKLTRIDELETNEPLDEIYDTDTEPLFYDVRGGSFFLYPASNYNSTGGIRIKYKRYSNYFTHTDTTKTTGLPAIHDNFIIKFASEQYCISKYPDRAVAFRSARQEMEDRIKRHWSRKGKDRKPALRLTYESSR